MEARVRIELTIQDLQSRALPLGDRAISNRFGEKEGGCPQDQVNSSYNDQFLDLNCLEGIFLKDLALLKRPNIPYIFIDATIPFKQTLQRINQFTTQ